MRRENEYKHIELANILREQIYSGYIKPGGYLLSENRLSDFFGISRTVVRASLEILMKEGLIIKQPSRGSIVAPDLKLPQDNKKTLRIVVTSPSEFVNTCMPIIIETFEREHPNVEVKMIGYPAGSFWDCLNGMEPDLLLITDRQLAEIESDEVLSDVHDSVLNSVTGIYPKLLSAFSKNNKFQAVPASFSTIFMAYNPDLFRKYGVPVPTSSWGREDFLHAAQQLTLDTNGDGITDLYGLSMSSSFSRWLIFLLQNNVQFFNKSIGKEHLEDALSFIHDLLYRCRVGTLFQSRRFHVNSDAFPGQKAAMVLATTIELTGWRKLMSFKPEVAALPFGDSDSTTVVGNLFAIPAICNNAELANLFIQTAIREDVQARMAEETRFISILNQVNEKIYGDEYLHSLHIRNGDIGNSFFLHELFPNPNDVLDLEQSMDWFWAGFESASAFADRVQSIIARRFDN